MRPDDARDQCRVSGQLDRTPGNVDDPAEKKRLYKSDSKPSPEEKHAQKSAATEHHVDDRTDRSCHLGKKNDFQGDPGNGDGPDQNQYQCSQETTQQDSANRCEGASNEKKNGCVIDAEQHTAARRIEVKQMVNTTDCQKGHHRDTKDPDARHTGNRACGTRL